MSMNLSRHIKTFDLNRPQAAFLTVMANESWLPWSRGTGKTTGATAPWILHKVEAMPGSSGALVGVSFSDLESKILKPLFAAFQMMGHKKDVHYTYGKEPPKSWKRSYIPIIDWKHVVAWPNGTNMQLVSLHMEGSANSNSFQWLCGPEAKYLDKDKLESEVFPTLRGNVEQFGDSPWYGAKMFETDKYHSDIHWILKKKLLHDPEVSNAIIYYQLEVNKLRMQLNTVEERQAYRIIKKIEKLTVILNALRKNHVYYSESKASDNIRNLSASYLKNMKRSLTPYQYRVSIENEDPTRVEGGFYPDRGAHHVHYKDDDDDVTQPLGVAMDWQASITPLVACQVNDRVIPGVESLNFLNSFYVMHPLGIPDVIKVFCEYYKHRICKHVVFYYDHTAIAKKAAGKSFHKEAEAAFKKNGWMVTLQYLGQAPLHELKYTYIKKLLSGEGRLPIRFHGKRCQSLLLPMDNTAVLPGTFKKDKRNETKAGYPQELATHLPDTFDTLAWAIGEQGKYPRAAKSNDVFVGIGIPGV